MCTVSTQLIQSHSITDQANVKAVTLAPPNPILHNAKWDLRSDQDFFGIRSKWNWN